ncbi:hypothetical protein SDC9_199782 [bioreactor metagenome]|uniref:Uncharacterized protein n=1 Tax=bioreactor metagenome TaxID=1076179 RepID=A0A645ILF5_9ZZZZ
MVSMPASRATSATIGAPPVPVPPPMPAVINTMSVFSSALAIWARFSSALLRPISGLEPAPCPCVSFSPICILYVALDTESACLSVFMATNSTPFVPLFTMRFTTLLPPPPTPMTFMLTTLSGPASNEIGIVFPPLSARTTSGSHSLSEGVFPSISCICFIVLRFRLTVNSSRRISPKF